LSSDSRFRVWISSSLIDCDISLPPARARLSLAVESNAVLTPFQRVFAVLPGQKIQMLLR
jgi:hypothetical protein